MEKKPNVFSAQSTLSLPWGSEVDRGVFQNPQNRSFPTVFFVLVYTGLIHRHQQEEFEGEIIHSYQYTTAKKYAGKKAVVVGAATAGHDVAFDLANHEVGQ